MRVLLVNAPFAAVERPALGLSLLKARLAECGVQCDVAYANLAFARTLGLETYQTVATGSPRRSLAGEWVFADVLFGASSQRDELYLRRVMGGMREEYLSALRRARLAAGDFIDRYFDSISWRQYDVVGCTSFCEQNLAALSLLKRVKEAFPLVWTAVGGANWHGTMGVAQLRIFPFVDIAFLGEADASLPSAVTALAEGKSLDGIPGLATRRNGEVHANMDELAFEDLAALPLPEYEDYFAAVRSTRFEGEFVTTLGVEGARGCWWAERHPCRFCGLNGAVRRYRSKPPWRLLGELRTVARLWPGCRIDIVDNVVSPAFLSEVLPALAAEPLGTPFFFEARPSLSKRELEWTVEAGATLQVGVESLSDHTLRLMAKGTRVVDLVRLLRMARCAGASLAWNIILGVPGETDDDYASMIELLPSISHLQPPESCAPLCLDRFSPYFERLDEWGFSGVRPHEPYRHVYRVPEDVLWELADTFDYDEELSRRRAVYRYRLRSDVRAWQSSEDRGDLQGTLLGNERLVLRDTRCGQSREYQLDPLETFLYLACDEARSGGALQELAREGFAEDGDVDEVVDTHLHGFVERRLMICRNGQYLSVAVLGRPASSSSRSALPGDALAERADQLQ